MLTYRVQALPDAIARAARDSLRSPQYGHPAYVEVARGYGPCRSCLRQFRIGAESRLLFTYNPFDGLDPYPLPGPIFIHAESCNRFEGDGVPPELNSLPLRLEGYADDRRLVTSERVNGNAVDDVIARVLADPSVRYIHLRNAEAGCFMAHIERVEVKSAAAAA